MDMRDKSSLSYTELYYRNLYFRTVLENSGDAFLVVNREGLIVEMNQSYCEFLGVKRENVLGKPVLDILPNSRLPEIIQTGESHIDDIHKYSGNRFTTACRIPVWDGDIIIAGIGIIRFPKKTMELAQTIQNLGEELAFYRTELQRHGISKFYFGNMLSSSRAFNEAKKLAERFAHNDLPILLLGETGSGKEVFATAIHHASERRRGPLIRVNCAAIPAELFESELFGYAEGAFTGSRKGGKKGKFELANGGTLFLDEIGDMPFSMQAKLLRVLQEREVEKIGSEKSIPVDVRIIAATNLDLKQRIAENTFRSDLFYRLNVLTVHIPPLRERLGDIHELTSGILGELNEQYKREIVISDEALSLMRSYSWPGNIRELRNELGRAFMLTEDNVIKPGNLSFAMDLRAGRFVSLPDATREKACGVQAPSKFMLASSGSVDANAQMDDVPPNEPSLSSPVTNFGGLKSEQADRERQLILDALSACHFNCTRAAKRLGVHRTTLYAKMAGLGIDITALRNG